MAPYLIFGCMLLACAIVPTLSTDLPLSPAADAIALVGLFALARVFISLAAMDMWDRLWFAWARAARCWWVFWPSLRC
jgi:formate hydrogenlyase subunit 4